MKLHSLNIKGFRKHLDSDITFSNATFLIGSNNAGKSSVLKALEYLLTNTSKIKEEDLTQILNQDKDNEKFVDEIVLTAEFRNVPKEAENWRGFNKQRLYNYDIENTENPSDTGICFFYRKTYNLKNCKIEMKQRKMIVRSKFQGCKKISDYIMAGLSESAALELFGEEMILKNSNITPKMLVEAEEIGSEELFELEDSDIWFENPGGIASNVISRLPKYLLIPDQSQTDELSGKNGALIKTLNSLFEDIRDSSENFRQAHKYLEKLAKELDPTDENSEFYIMLKELNGVVSEVFPSTTFVAEANLSNANKVIVPQFDISLESNVNTSVSNQGTGVIRSAIFAMLRYRSMRENRIKESNGEIVRPLLIAFEEPEIFLHPKAAMQMRDTIYQLSKDASHQIICTTHSPYMINLSETSSQILNSLTICEEKHDEVCFEKVKVNPFNISKAFKSLQSDDKTFVKMLLKIDDSIAKVFFAKNVLIVEGDTEEIVVNETIERMENEKRKEFQYDWEVVKARGKAVIISLVKYLKAMGINPYVIHDRDSGKKKAEQFNPHILCAVGNTERVFVLEECIEDILGYEESTYDKPYKAYKHIKDSWGSEWEDIPLSWRSIFEKIM